MTLTGVTLSDFNVENFDALLAGGEAPPAIRMLTAPYGQPVQTMVDPDAGCWAESPDFAIVWTRPEAVLESYAAAQAFEPTSTEALLAEVDRFVAQLTGLRERVQTVLVPCWTRSAERRSRGLFDLADRRGTAFLLQQANARLAERLVDESSVHLLDATRWLEGAGAHAFSPKLWYMAKVPFGNPVLKAAARDVRKVLAAIGGGAGKLIVVDLDQTLWGGIVGEVGWEQLTLGGHDPAGEAFVAFQEALKALKRQGVILAIVSKNEEAVALAAIDQHPEQVLRRDDFAAWRINWLDKARNVAEIVDELNLGLQSTVFIDDNPAERARVREALPEVTVPEWPSHPLEYPLALADLACFATPSLTEEDLQRADMYRSARQRDQSRAEVGSLDEWLETLDTTIAVAPLEASTLPRAAQLFNKTNQMNLATRRLPEAALAEWAATAGHRLWTFTVSDRFGSHGLTGLVGATVEGGRLTLVDFLLSCRVMGRKVEDAMLAVALRYATEQGLGGVDLEFLPTEKNAPCLAFFEGSGLRRGEGGRSFHWEASDGWSAPAAVTLHVASL